ncbi:MAG: guanylate kinase [Propionibacteriaceae bacterium]|nr:guanylate kinase [Propionibacteriaceae bacterium]
MAAGDVTVISGPTAVGKGTLVKLLKDRNPQIWVSVSVTTRPPRPGEVDGVHYYFISDSRFDELLSRGGLLEWAVVHQSARYGTPKAEVVKAVEAGRKVILEIDLQGARQVKETYPEARFIFIAPPDTQALLDRLAKRGSETAEQIAQRMETAKIEMRAESEFDHIVINDDLETAYQQLVDLLGV